MPQNATGCAGEWGQSAGGDEGETRELNKEDTEARKKDEASPLRDAAEGTAGHAGLDKEATGARSASWPSGMPQNAAGCARVVGWGERRALSGRPGMPQFAAGFRVWSG
jgi:hypothetical protein